MVLKKQSIPESVKQEVNKIIDHYNRTIYCKDESVKYIAEFKGSFLYLKRIEFNGVISPMARLTYAGRMDKWKFAIFRWTLDAYDPDEWFFPGCEFVNGTILGALKAGDEAYPVDY
jgi:hypothetical protein